MLIKMTLIAVFLCVCLYSEQYDWFEGTRELDNGATRDYYNRAAKLLWKNKMGDWHDSTNAAQEDKSFGEVKLSYFDTEQWIQIGITMLVKKWHDGTLPDKGLLLRIVDGKTTHLFRSRETDNMPKLQIYQGQKSTILNATADTYLDNSTYQGFGDHDQLKISAQNNILIRFDISELDQTEIDSACLKLFDFKQYSGTGIMGVFACDQGDKTSQQEERQLGIAQHYASDSGIENNSDVFFATGFESDSWEEKWTSVSSNGNYIQLDSDISNKFKRFIGNAVRARLVKGKNYGGSIIYKFKNEVGIEPEEIFWRYYLRLGDNWNPISYGGKFPGVSGTYGKAGWGGRPVHGDDGWSARGSFSIQTTRANPLGKVTPIGYYCYHVDMEGSYGHIWNWTKGYRGFLENNRWYCIEQQVKMNTPGQNNGILRGWVDGYPAFEKTDINFRTVTSLKIEQIWMNLYHGGTVVSPSTMDQYYDNLVIAKKYIGPIINSMSGNPGHDVKKKNNVEIYRNNRVLLIKLNKIVKSKLSPVNIYIFNTLGKIKYAREVYQLTNEISVNCSSYSPGIYFLAIQGGKITCTITFII